MYGNKRKIALDLLEISGAEPVAIENCYFVAAFNKSVSEEFVVYRQSAYRCTRKLVAGGDEANSHV